MIEAVIWDFGGVLTSSPFEAFIRFEDERGLPTDIIRRTNAEFNSLDAQYEAASAYIKSQAHAGWSLNSGRSMDRALFDAVQQKLTDQWTTRSSRETRATIC